MKREMTLVIVVCAVLSIMFSVRSFVRGLPEFGLSAHTSVSVADNTESSNRPADEIITSSTTEVEPFTWVVVGDSLTEKNYTAQVSYYDYVAEDLGCVVVNYGAGNTGYMWPGYAEPFYERVAQMDLSGVDVVTIFGSFNDLGKGYELGSALDDGTGTVGGCMNLTIEGILAANPSVKLGIVTPTRWLDGYAFDADGYFFGGTTSREECDEYVALLKEVAARHSLPVLDLYQDFSLDLEDEDALYRYFTEDGISDESLIHFNSEGHRLLYPLWRGFMFRLMVNVEDY